MSHICPTCGRDYECNSPLARDSCQCYNCAECKLQEDQDYDLAKLIKELLSKVPPKVCRAHVDGVRCTTTTKDIYCSFHVVDERVRHTKYAELTTECNDMELQTTVRYNNCRPDSARVSYYFKFPLSNDVLEFMTRGELQRYASITQECAELRRQHQDTFYSPGDSRYKEHVEYIATFLVKAHQSQYMLNNFSPEDEARVQEALHLVDERHSRHKILETFEAYERWHGFRRGYPCRVCGEVKEICKHPRQQPDAVCSQLLDRFHTSCLLYYGTAYYIYLLIN